ncbi:hypothetical protein G7046_g8054 [Stylonectria norvegica]|nr:hypothetical protein G7046_g8054 [Stylonectria norvegica]
MARSRGTNKRELPSTRPHKQNKGSKANTTTGETDSDTDDDSAKSDCPDVVASESNKCATVLGDDALMALAQAGLSQGAQSPVPPIKTDIEGRYQDKEREFVETAMREFESKFPNGEWCPKERLPKTLSKIIIGAFRVLLNHWISDNRDPADLWGSEGIMNQVFTKGSGQKLSQKTATDARNLVAELVEQSSPKPSKKKTTATALSISDDADSTSSVRLGSPVESQTREVTSPAPQLDPDLHTQKRKNPDNPLSFASDVKIEIEKYSTEATRLLTDFADRRTKFRRLTLGLETSRDEKLNAAKADEDTLQAQLDDCKKRKQSVEELEAQLKDAREGYETSHTALQEIENKVRLHHEGMHALKQDAITAREYLDKVDHQFLSVKAALGEEQEKGRDKVDEVDEREGQVDQEERREAGDEDG